MVLAWTDTTRVETKTVDSSRGLLNTISIKTSGNDANGNPHTLFASVPEPEAIWVLTETAGGATVSSSSKQYKILAISESSKGEMSFTGAEHYDEKFKAVAFSNIFVRALNKYIIHCIGIFLYIFFWFIVASELLSHKIHKPININ